MNNINTIVCDIGTLVDLEFPKSYNDTGFFPPNIARNRSGFFDYFTKDNTELKNKIFNLIKIYKKYYKDDSTKVEELKNKIKNLLENSGQESVNKLQEDYQKFQQEQNKKIQENLKYSKERSEIFGHIKVKTSSDILDVPDIGDAWECNTDPNEPDNIETFNLFKNIYGNSNLDDITKEIEIKRCCVYLNQVLSNEKMDSGVEGIPDKLKVFIDRWKQTDFEEEMKKFDNGEIL